MRNSPIKRVICNQQLTLVTLSLVTENPKTRESLINLSKRKPSLTISKQYISLQTLKQLVHYNPSLVSAPSTSQTKRVFFTNSR